MEKYGFHQNCLKILSLFTRVEATVVKKRLNFSATAHLSNDVTPSISKPILLDFVLVFLPST